MSDAATPLPEGDDKQYVVLVVGDLTVRQHEMLAQNLDFFAKLTRQEILTIRVEVTIGIYATPIGGYRDDIGEYLKKFSQMLAPSVVVHMVYSCDQRPEIEGAFSTVFPEAHYEVFGDDGRRITSSNSVDPSKIKIEELEELSTEIIDRLKSIGIQTVADLLGEGELARTMRHLRSFLSSDEQAVQEVAEVLKARGFPLREEG